MTIIVVALAGVLVFTPRHAFRELSVFDNNRYYETSTVKAQSGLSIRDQPTTSGTLLKTAPDKAKLTVIDNDAAQDIIDGKKGSWYKVEYLGTTGYAWGNYIDY